VVRILGSLSSYADIDLKKDGDDENPLGQGPPINIGMLIKRMLIKNGSKI